MRIISGKFRKKAIHPPKNFRARPTTDVAKESLFNIIENNFEIDEINVLDLFSGTGSISYEFASRECPDIISVELNYHHFNFIRKTCQELDITDQILAVKTNTFVYLKSCGRTFDLIFADPPYDLDNIDKIPAMVFEKDLLKPEGWLIVEHSDSTDLSAHPHFWMHKRYGKVNFSFFRKA